MNKVTIQTNFNGATLAEGVIGQTVQVVEEGWYFAPEAVDTTYLRITDRIYTCPYKGVCYWIDLDAPEMRAQNVAWVYSEPKRGYEKIKGLIAFSRRGSNATIATEQARAV